MKIRNSLVSNSSSSSFIIIGNRIGISQLSESNIVVDDKIKIRTYVIGRYLYEGLDVFSISQKEQLLFIKDNPELFNEAIVGRMYTESTDDVTYPLPSEFPSQNDLILRFGTCDQNSSYHIQTMLDNYKEKIQEKLAKIAWDNVNKKYKGENHENKKRISK